MMSSYHDNSWPSDSNAWDAESPAHLQMEVSSVMSFASSSGGVPLDQALNTPDESRRSSQQLEAKIDMVYSLLAMLGGQEHADMGETLLALSTNPESCLAMRQSGCLPLLVQLVQSDRDSETRKKAAEALHNLVHSQPDEKLRKRETRILKLLETVSYYTETLEFICDNVQDDKHPVQIVSQMMKYSFDEGYRQAICQLGGIHSIAKLMEMEHKIHGGVTEETNCNLLRKYSCMVLTNLTFGDSGNKALLCSYKDFIKALVIQLQSPNDELRQVTASVLRNLSWRADSTSKEILKDVGCVRGLMKAAMMDNKENTLISILSALWNLSAHCTENKSEICSVRGALMFLVQMLSYKSSSESLAIIENSGGILRNISSQIAGREDYRDTLRKHNCLQVLLNQLKSTNITIVSNACGTLWNLSSQNAADQELLWDLGAPTVLKSLNNSKHKMIAMGSSATLKNLLRSKPHQSLPQTDSEQPLDLSNYSSSEMKGKTLHSNLTEVETALDLSEKKSRVSPIFAKKTHEIKSSSFANLNTNEHSSGNFNHENRSRMLRSCGSSSLPYVNSTKSEIPCSSRAPCRNKYSDNYDNELESSEEPFDFSRRYSETKRVNDPPKDKCTTDFQYEETKNDKENFSIYAETDLDQPTDYSLRYAENDSDSDSEVCDNAQKTAAEFVRDTLKTYCTEGTPYETPFNFSTSTSMSDLRVNEKNVIENDKNTTKEKKTKELVPSAETKCLHENNSKMQPAQMSKMKSELSSGLMSPEKPMNYCEEGTPGYFSRVSSFGSLNSSPVCGGEEKVLGKDTKCNDEVLLKDDKTQHKVSASEGKMVKFENNVNYCEETPLMFSRSSSLGSLGSIEQHSIHDDRSSVISDFSRLTSGIISPSELPDSPTQTVPPSPKPQKTPEYPVIHRRISVDRSHQSARRSLPKVSVFEDDVTKFKEESTPAQYSMATSLSSLTIDDQDENQIGESCGDTSSNLDNCGKRDSIHEKKINSPLEEVDGPAFSRGGIRASMLSRRHRQSTPTCRQPTPNFQDASQLPIQKSTSSTSATVNIPGPLPPPLAVDNTIHTYCTEDTPAVLSHNGSISDLSLSTLSMLDEEPVLNRVYLSENSSQSSTKDENVDGRKSEVLNNRRSVDNIWNKNESSQISTRQFHVENIDMPPYLTVGDEICQFAVEDSPMQFSLRSSLSNLTFESSMTSGLKESPPKKPTTSTSSPTETWNDKEKSAESVNLPSRNINFSNVSNNIKESLANESAENINLSRDEECSDIKEEENERSVCFHEETGSSTMEDSYRVPLSKSVKTDSLKKRKWKWKWKFGSEESDQKESIQVGESESNNEATAESTPSECSGASRMNEMYSRSLDRSYKKKKWWKWKFGSKDADSSDISVNIPKIQQSKADSDNTDPQNNTEAPVSVLQNREEDEEFSEFKREGSLDNRNKSKRWKWKWKFGSKDGENTKPELISLGMSKLKHTVSPMRSRESYIVGASLEPTSLGNQRESRCTTPRSLKLFRSLSEPRNNKKCSEENGVGKVQERSLDTKMKFHEDKTSSENPLKKEESNTTSPSTNSIEMKCSEVSLDRRRMPEMERTDDKSCSSNLVSTLSSANGTSENHHKIGPLKANYAALIEECIQLGMPKKIESSEVTNCVVEADVQSEMKLLTEAQTNTFHEETKQPINSSHNTSVDHMAILEECIQLGMPKNKENTPNEVISSGAIQSSRVVRLSNETKSATCGKNPGVVEKHMDSTNNISKAQSLDKSPIATTPKNTDISKRGMTEAFSKSYLTGSNKIGKNDLEFLKRQLSMKDKHFLKETVAKGITKEQEALFIEMLIVNRVREESNLKAAHSELEASDSNSSPIKKSDQSCESNSANNLLNVYSEETLDPVTLSIVKRILRHRFSDEDESDALSEESGINYKYHDSSIALQQTSKSSLIKKENSGDQTVRANDSSETTTPISRAEENKVKASSSAISKICWSKENSNVEFDRIPGNDTSQELLDRSADIRASRRTSVTDTKFYSKNNECTLIEKRMDRDIVNETAGSLKKDEIEETPSNDPISSNSSQKKPDYVALVEECIQLGMPKKKELSEEAIYANISLSPGYSRSNSMKKKSSSRTIDKNDTSSSNSNRPQHSEAQALVEECIKIGSSRKIQTVHHNVHRESPERNDRNPIKTNKNADYAALLEECIQLGMPSSKLTPKKANSLYSEERLPQKCPSPLSNSKTYASNSISSPMTKSKQSHIRSVEECINLAMSKRKEESEEAIYANVSTTAGYSKSSTMERPIDSPLKWPSLSTKETTGSDTESKTSRNGTLDKKKDYSHLVEECIQLGMPPKCKREVQTFPKGNSSNGTFNNVKKPTNYDALIEECIQLGMPKKKNCPEENIYANTTERFSTFKGPTRINSLPRSLPKKMTRSDSEPGSSRIPFANFEKNRTESAVLISSSSMEKAVEEYIQLNWPRRAETITVSRTIHSNTVSESSRDERLGESKNVDVASVARNTLESRRVCSRVPAMATGAEDDSRLQEADRMTNLRDTEETHLVDFGRNGSDLNTVKFLTDETDECSEMSFAQWGEIDAKLLDPEAMLKSLDQYTSELISQAELRLKCKRSISKSSCACTAD
ncbi:hypothetical protein HHI36_013799 [Cryptolaemus montrouzieri]|uniref:Adenomatous polyposis coli protein n=1 Tax=Cryptolaemus montrouzieri TaxID=559131 RepID=A0ABD2NJA7_9CUCU